jgi:uncharacterized protein YbjT (DUF2867 family)
MTESKPPPPSPPATICVLGASGLIGRALADDLAARGHRVVGVARRFAAGQAAPDDVTLPIVAADAATLARLFQDQGIDLVVNCLGVLQDGPGRDTHEVHTAFIARLIAAMRATPRRIRLVQVSIPGDPADDATAFSRSKRAGEALIRNAGLPFALLRPGFVIAPAAYGGSALLRGLAALPLDLGARDAATPFQSVAVADIAATVAWIAAHDPPEDPVWDLVAPEAVSLGDVLATFRARLGTQQGLRLALPGWLLDIGARLGDAVAWLGWAPPVRRNALAELRRGVRGDPRPWLAATGIAPLGLAASLPRVATIQEKWFARLFLLKPAMIAVLVAFWLASGLIALTMAYDAAVAILTTRGFSSALAHPFTIVSSLMDCSVGLLIAVRRSCRVGLMAGVAVSLGYMAGCAVLTPDLWLEPLGALVKTGPAIVLMLATLAILDDR